MKQSLFPFLVAALLLPLFGCSKHAEPEVSRGVLTQYKDFPSQYVAPRTIRVWTPSDYNPDSLYSVIYMHDGQMLYDADFSWNHQEWGVDEVVDSLVRSGLIPPCIVVGIDNADRDRIAEYAPDDVAQFLPQDSELYAGLSPMGNRYLRFVVEELKPFIDSVYSTRADANHTYMIGSSCGGLISSYALCKYPEVFGGVGCLSTHCTFRTLTSDVNPSATAAYIQYLRTYLPLPNTHRLYMDCGDQTLDEAYIDIMSDIAATIRELDWDEQHFRYRFFPGAAHTETDWQARLPQVLEFLCDTTKTE